MTQGTPPFDERQTYASVYEMAKQHALRHVAASQASEVAHDVASSILQWSVARGAPPEPGRTLGAFVYRAVINRLRDSHRRRGVRDAAEQLHAGELQDTPRAWDNPAEALEADELASLVRGIIAEMPPSMRTIFLMVREHDRSYKEVAAELNLAVGTVHTQISRAYALLRVAIEHYRGDDAFAGRKPRSSHHLRTSA